MSVAKIGALLGPALDERCSGLYCSGWRVADGRILVVSYSDPCGYPLSVELRPGI